MGFPRTNFRSGRCKQNDTNILLLNYFWYVLIDMASWILATEYYLTQIVWWFCSTIQGRIQPYHANKNWSIRFKLNIIYIENFSIFIMNWNDSVKTQNRSLIIVAEIQQLNHQIYLRAQNVNSHLSHFSAKSSSVKEFFL